MKDDTQTNKTWLLEHSASYPIANVLIFQIFYKTNFVTVNTVFEILAKP